MRLNKPTSIFAAGCCAFALAVSLQGCGNGSQGQTSQEQQSQTSAQSAEQSTASVASTASTASTASAKQTLGTKTETSLEVAMRNETGSVLDEVGVKRPEDTEYSANLLAAGSTMKKGEEAVLYVDSASQTCSVRVHAQDTGEYLEFSDVPTANLKSMSLIVANGEYYVDYTTTDGTNASTKSPTGEVAAAGAAAAVATETAGDTEEYVDTADADTSYTDAGEDYDYYVDDTADDTQDYSADYEVAEPVVETTAVEEVAVPEQSADACQGDVVLRD